jgi:hypothetical protein
VRGDRIERGDGIKRVIVLSERSWRSPVSTYSRDVCTKYSCHQTFQTTCDLMALLSHLGGSIQRIDADKQPKSKAALAIVTVMIFEYQPNT